MDPQILYKDNFLLVIEKPAQMIVNDADSTKGQKTLQEWVEEKFKIQNLKFKIGDKEKYVVDGYNKFDEFVIRSGIVHRLDKETSGIILVALTPEVFINLQNQFKNGSVKKTYMALVHGNLEPKEGEVDSPVGRLPWNRMRFGVLSEGRTARTHYRVVEYMQNRDSKNLDKFSYVEVQPKTGRTHQIRVHFQHLGHSIVSDALYAGRKVGRTDRKKLSRHFLHASKIEFHHPSTMIPFIFSSPLPDDLRAYLEELVTQS